MKNRIKIQVDGKTFTLMGEGTEAHLKEVSSYIDEKMRHVRENAAAIKLDSSLAYVLTSLNVADDYFKEKEYRAELEGRVLGLTARLEEMTRLLEDATNRTQDSELGLRVKELEEELLNEQREKLDAQNKLDEYTLAAGNEAPRTNYKQSGKKKYQKPR